MRRKFHDIIQLNIAFCPSDSQEPYIQKQSLDFDLQNWKEAQLPVNLIAMAGAYGTIDIQKLFSYSDDLVGVLGQASKLSPTILSFYLD